MYMYIIVSFFVGAYIEASKTTLSFRRENIKLQLHGADKFKLGIPYYAKVCINSQLHLI